MKSDIEIAQAASLNKITEVAAGIGVTEDDLELYGKYKAKLSWEYIEKLNPDELKAFSKLLDEMLA